MAFKKYLFISMCGLLLICGNAFCATVSISVSPSSLTFDVSPSRNWTEDITDALWQEKSVTISVDGGNIVLAERSVFVYFQHANQSYWPSSDAATVTKLNTISSAVGLNGLLNIQTTDSSRPYDSQIPVRMNVASASLYNRTTTLYETADSSKNYYVGLNADNTWKYVLDRGQGSYNANSDMLWKTWNPYTSEKFELGVKVKVAVPMGKYAGSYQGTIIVTLQTQ